MTLCDELQSFYVNPPVQENTNLNKFWPRTTQGLGVSSQVRTNVQEYHECIARSMEKKVYCKSYVDGLLCHNPYY